MDSKELEFITGEIVETNKQIYNLESKMAIIKNKNKIYSKTGNGLFMGHILICVLYIIGLKYLQPYINVLGNIFLSLCGINIFGQIVNAVLLVKNTKKYKKLSNELYESFELLATKEKLLEKLMNRIKTKHIENNNEEKTIACLNEINIHNSKGKTRIRKRDK